ncbi:MAG: DUF5674 family protein [bacterium]|jgi:Protein of unknown function (DUF5674)
MKSINNISIKEIHTMAEKMYGDMVKADVDIVRRLMVLDMGMHSDGEAYLLEDGSKQDDLWGINLHPADYGSDDFIEFDSMINIRPRQGNPSKDVLDPEVKKQIIEIVQEKIHD